MKALYCLMAWLPSIASAANAILPIDRGLTLAEIQINGMSQTIAVMEDNGVSIKGVNLGKLFSRPLPPLALYREQGYDNIVKQLTSATENNIQEYPYEQLLSPAGKQSLHYAVGLNYSDHASEVDQNTTPFTFLKTVQATREHPISYESNRLLDYEVEICARPLNTIQQPNPGEYSFAYFLCGDFTDRAKLLAEFDLDNPNSGRGFSNAKSLPNHFPTGPYLVIPTDDARFVANLELSLRLNGELRQNSYARNMIWSRDKIIQDIFLAHKSGRNTYSNTETQWLPNGELETSSSILTGTPEGVIIRPPSIWYKIKKSTEYIVTGAFLSTDHTIKRYVTNAYIEDLIEENSFLQAGDQLYLASNWLGSIKLRID